VIAGLRFSLAARDATPAQRADLHAAMLDMAAYADERGFASLTVSEHHGTDLGWSPSPLMLAGAVAARTSRLPISVAALVLPLHDPVRVAEDLVTLDLVSRGRAATVVGLGYRPEEYAAHRVDWSRRGEIMDRSIELMRTAWTGRPFEHGGRTIRVTPAPFTDPHPPLAVGGQSRAAARRAARFDLPFAPSAYLPELAEYYRARCRELGRRAVCRMPPADLPMIHVTEDPDGDWAKLGPYLLDEARAYASWQPPGAATAVYSDATTVDGLRRSGVYRMLTPEQCLARAEAGEWLFLLHPLCGGLPIEEAWRSLTLFAERVLPHARGASRSTG
jgi:alkanesulfonate monooxygenase SsuD/methylene tetrahydromethanopterin reductase-like flavin-dependent oxidoreductase (luciferase family)